MSITKFRDRIEKLAYKAQWLAMGLEELTSYKYIVRGSGQVRG
jgi:hypothetical protein